MVDREKTLLNRSTKERLSKELGKPGSNPRIVLPFTLGALSGIVLSFILLNMMGYSLKTTFENAERWLKWSSSPKAEEIEASISEAEERLGELKSLQEELIRKEEASIKGEESL